MPRGWRQKTRLPVNAVGLRMGAGTEQNRRQMGPSGLNCTNKCDLANPVFVFFVPSAAGSHERLYQIDHLSLRVRCQPKVLYISGILATLSRAA